jgi:hypothetical protein
MLGTAQRAERRGRPARLFRSSHAKCVSLEEGKGLQRPNNMCACVLVCLWVAL